MPESARWLIAKGKLKQAQYYLQECARVNCTEGFADKIKAEVSKFQMTFMEVVKEFQTIHRNFVFPLLKLDNTLSNHYAA